MVQENGNDMVGRNMYRLKREVDSKAGLSPLVWNFKGRGRGLEDKYRSVSGHRLKVLCNMGKLKKWIEDNGPAEELVEMSRLIWTQHKRELDSLKAVQDEIEGIIAGIRFDW